MKVESVVVLIAGAVALATAGYTAWQTSKTAEGANANALAIEQLKIESDEAQRRREISGYSEPLARAAYDLQSRS
jgi:uncharacterized protein HemX